jgi:glycosyltransferase involved in cell wall biosynthesis
LIVSRLVAYKKIELAISACNRLRRRLVIVGSGVEYKKLKRLCGPTVKMAGKLTASQLVLYYQSCRALLVPQEEDFGISLVEAQAAGKPVIAYNKGGASEIIKEGKTGIFFAQQTVESLTQAIVQFEKLSFYPKECYKNAKKFDKSQFIKKFPQKLEDLWEKKMSKNAQ